MKQTTLLVLAALWLATPALGQGDFAQRCPTGQTLCYQVLADSASVRLTHAERNWPYYADNKPVGRMEVPAEVRHKGRSYRVAEVGECAFYRCEGLQEVLLPDGCRRVGAQAFNGCTSLRAVTFGAGLEQIGDGAFAYCAALERVDIPLSVQRLGASAFALCSGLERLSIGEALWHRRGSLVFHGCPLAEEAKNVKKGPSGVLILSR